MSYWKKKLLKNKILLHTKKYNLQKDNSDLQMIWKKKNQKDKIWVFPLKMKVSIILNLCQVWFNLNLK